MADARLNLVAYVTEPLQSLLLCALSHNWVFKRPVQPLPGERIDLRATLLRALANDDRNLKGDLPKERIEAFCALVRAIDPDLIQRPDGQRMQRRGFKTGAGYLESVATVLGIR